MATVVPSKSEEPVNEEAILRKHGRELCIKYLGLLSFDFLKLTNHCIKKAGLEFIEEKGNDLRIGTYNDDVLNKLK